MAETATDTKKDEKEKEKKPSGFVEANKTDMLLDEFDNLFEEMAEWVEKAPDTPAGERHRTAFELYLAALGAFADGTIDRNITYDFLDYAEFEIEEPGLFETVKAWFDTYVKFDRNGNQLVDGDINVLMLYVAIYIKNLRAEAEGGGAGEPEPLRFFVDNDRNSIVFFYRPKSEKIRWGFVDFHGCTYSKELHELAEREPDFFTVPVGDLFGRLLPEINRERDNEEKNTFEATMWIMQRTYLENYIYHARAHKDERGRWVFEGGPSVILPRGHKFFPEKCEYRARFYEVRKRLKEGMLDLEIVRRVGFSPDGDGEEDGAGK